MNNMFCVKSITTHIPNKKQDISIVVMDNVLLFWIKTIILKKSISNIDQTKYDIGKYIPDLRPN